MDTNNQTIYQAFKKSAKDFPLGTAIYYQGRKIYFNGLLRKVDRMASVLTSTLGIKKGDVVMISQPNIPDAIILFLAVNKIGAVANMVHPFTPFNQLAAIYKKNNCKVAFLFEQRVAKEVEAYRQFSEHIIVTRIEDFLPMPKRILYHVFKNHHIRRVLGNYMGLFKGFRYLHKLGITPNRRLAKEVSNDSKKVAVLLHSGSTTGDPKTICLANDSFTFLCSKGCEFLCVSPEYIRGSVMLSILPSFHGFGLCMTMLTPLLNSFGVALVPKFTPKEVLKVMRHNRMSCMCGVPKVYESLLNYPKFVNSKKLKNLVTGFCGGDSMNLTLKHRWDTVMKDANSRCQVFEGYGLTEAIAVNCVNTFMHNKAGSIGYPASGIEIKIIDEDGKELPKNQTGEICVKSLANMLGYYKDEKATKETFTDDGFIKTGDLGYIDDDGFVFFKLRKKRVVKVSGVGVFPTEVERLVESVPGVKACCAIEIPDPKLVSAIKIFVVAKYYDEIGMRRNIMDTCRRYLIRWAVPKEIEFRDELPYTLLNKVDFKKLQEEENKKRGL